MNFSIVIPTYNAQKFLPPLLKILSDDRLKDKVFFIDSTSSDGTVETLAEAGFKNITIIDSAVFDHGGTRSLAKDLTDREIVVFLTQDALPTSADDIITLVNVFENNKISAAYGKQIPYDSTSLFGTHLRYFNYTDTPYIRCIDDIAKFGIKTAFMSNSFAAYRRSAMEGINWFEENLLFGEDAHATARLLKKGDCVAYEPSAKVYHSHSYTLLEDFKRYFDVGVFHQMESWLIDEFGKPKGEGMKYIKSEFNFILKQRKLYLIPEFFVRNGLKFLAYKLGNNHHKLPKNIVLMFSMHKRWWLKNNVISK
ncbi:glycosyltransferase [Amphritea sp. 1_MG-2023]|uniref:glycosyltransferase family 2 protein n=1 Tax=Amphritea sp. 1_MG-2023 TaxID=3062670 RepID=UPI0026E15D03|nr:glycosyltransferase [Amphritea sp. 1_MG-2023]MDO6565144.1 glycosyltransferase [Amphritea sp. 1_MG-2023]